MVMPSTSSNQPSTYETPVDTDELFVKVTEESPSVDNTSLPYDSSFSKPYSRPWFTFNDILRIK